MCVCEHAGRLPGTPSSESANRAVSVIPAAPPSLPVTRASDSCPPWVVTGSRGVSLVLAGEPADVQGLTGQALVTLVGMAVPVVNQCDGNAFILLCSRPMRGQTGIPLSHLSGQLLLSSVPFTHSVTEGTFSHQAPGYQLSFLS